MIRRSTSSDLILNEKGDRLSLRSCMPFHEVKTIEVEYRDEEDAEAQWVHRVYARLV